MTLVDRTLDRPAGERESCLRAQCGDVRLFDEVWNYVRWEERMSNFLLKPLCPPVPDGGPFQAGEMVDRRFRIVREVAQGGMGVVYEAVDEKLGRRVAIKSAKSGFRQRLSPEGRNAREITHPNVCRIFEIHTAEGARGDIDFITMEFLEGETLADRLSRERLPGARRWASRGRSRRGWPSRIATA
jgi:serine/threonine protein kinase